MSVMPRSPITSKICPACGLEKSRFEYYKKGDSISHKCKPCTLQDNQNRSANYIGKYSDYQNEWRRNRYESDPAYRERVSQQKKSSYDSRKDAINAARRERWANDPMNPARKYFRRKDVKDRTPKWVDLNQILQIYAKCPHGYHVDHIVPLKGIIDGRPVSGLHVPWNLQYLTPEQNLRKRNKISEETLLQILVKR